ncbi:hypothetical protein FNH05_23705 [Amycolatopsis rhizosphaerae]|uniref:Uncharacterized protein n=1 Tax=Amycolatopsis rhizosphaerae TaxID=2053003 RepID=A0A558BTJ6_9PSEU|nr:hypothetical protein [Amycolatopsis rhizosphaerae]TVT39856.1 hypothetical protein FNH05_23705 [Amycolatopsis rhizosphaerae]
MNESGSAAIGAAAAAAAAVWGSPVAGAVAGLAVTEAARAAAPGASGGFEFPSVEEMNTVLGMWKDRQASLLRKKNTIEQIRMSLQELAEDPESEGYLKRFSDSFDLLYEQHDSMVAYVGDYVQKLTTATKAKQTDEENVQAALGKHTDS